MNPMNHAWTLLKGGMSNIDLILRENQNDPEKAKREIMADYPHMKEDELQHMIDEWHEVNSPPPQFPSLVNDMSEEKFTQLAGNEENLVHPSGRLPGSTPPKPDDNPLGLDLDKIREISEGNQ